VAADGWTSIGSMMLSEINRWTRWLARAILMVYPDSSLGRFP